MFLKKRKQPIQKKFVATAVGHAPWGTRVAEYFYNLYEYEDGEREYEEFDGGQYHDHKMPDKVDYSTKAQVKAWIYGGDLPKSVLSYEALIDEVNSKIKKRTVKAVKTYDDIDSELEKALDIQLCRYQNEKK
ncbi:hypothetical protein [Bartonella tribocorum]|uniref:Uncharacterized protein n=1 Tax=Bartonella tribocorum TaxID=85701 RepID=A0A2M6UU77_9HYPH|nr:hypothetical protein [Bartonella tribocorum]PIT69760.1 hypothetical protein CER18_01705 [Bartonella tribocorum]